MATERSIEVGDIVYWMYSFSSTFPNFYKVTKKTEKSIWIQKMDKKYNGDLVRPDTESEGSEKEKRIAVKDGKAYYNYMGHKMNLHVWNGDSIQTYSD